MNSVYAAVAKKSLAVQGTGQDDRNPQRRVNVTLSMAQRRHRSHDKQNTGVEQKKYRSKVEYDTFKSRADGVMLLGGSVAFSGLTMAVIGFFDTQKDPQQTKDLQLMGPIMIGTGMFLVTCGAIYKLFYTLQERSEKKAKETAKKAGNLAASQSQHASIRNETAEEKMQVVVVPTAAARRNSIAPTSPAAAPTTNTAPTS